MNKNRYSMPGFTAVASIGHDANYQTIFSDHSVRSIQLGQAAQRAGHTGEGVSIPLDCVRCQECIQGPDGKITCTNCVPVPCPPPKLLI